MDAILDTSVFIGPVIRVTPEPVRAAVSTVTLAELQLGVLLADDPEVRAMRLARFAAVEATFEAIAVDRPVASAYADLVAAARRAGRRPRPLDGLIAATAIVRRVPVYTRDRGFFGLPGLDVVIIE